MKTYALITFVYVYLPARAASVVDFGPYTGTFEGGLLISSAVILGICWLMVTSHRKKLKPAVIPLEACHRLALKESRREQTKQER